MVPQGGLEGAAEIVAALMHGAGDLRIPAVGEGGNGAQQPDHVFWEAPSAVRPMWTVSLPATGNSLASPVFFLGGITSDEAICMTPADAEQLDSTYDDSNVQLFLTPTGASEEHGRRPPGRERPGGGNDRTCPGRSGDKVWRRRGQ